MQTYYEPLDCVAAAAAVCQEFAASVISVKSNARPGGGAVGGAEQGRGGGGDHGPVRGPRHPRREGGASCDGCTPYTML